MTDQDREDMMFEDEMLRDRVFADLERESGSGGHQEQQWGEEDFMLGNY